MISALFVQSNGCYFNDTRIDAWDIKKDARLYNGPNAVIAHPPCQLWGKLATVNYVRWGGDHNKPGNDDGCFKSALESVNKYCGVLEHPANTKAFETYGIGKPNKSGWKRTGKGWVCEVWQSAYGHKANKATWLYYVGFNKPFELKWDKIKGTHQIGRQDQRGKLANKPTLNKKEANATPIEFKELLISLAEYSRKYYL